ncbi:ATP-binding protein [Actinokineospora iranica]|uniref:Predicted ATPase n=1 Tax=Actinokineospora iranica TaxID=1271860 RepID=A0A1G6QHA9_9PSEU|nr:AAA family ATPase [Actinokineospora iranica]SDC91096.1 Predicted ATPase [Actinokineospora iranica]
MAGGPPVELTSYLGRDREDARVRDLLTTARLVTLTGPGGVGKTRLATTVAREVAATYPDGVVFVGLAELRNPALLGTLVADRLGLRDQSGAPAEQAVLDHLRDRRALLVLDNCEHLVDSCVHFVQAVLTGCPGVTVLATSRQSLTINGEQIVRVPPLPVPRDGEIPADLMSFDGVRLFVDRASMVDPAFQVTDDNRADIARLCERLDGLPLAIELAAARVQSLSPRQILDRLTAHLSLLTSRDRTAPARQRALLATIEWSHDLCTADERTLWARASVFAGSFDLDAAERVCGDFGLDRDGVLDLLDGLLDKSVLLREAHNSVTRYRMLETLREYGQERLEEAGDLARVRRLHRDWFDRLTEQADADWTSPRQLTWLDRLRHDHGNLRAALGWSVSVPGEETVALRMMTRIDEYWTLRGFNSEARLWLDRALSTTADDDPNRPLALSVSALFALWQYDFDAANARLAQAARLPRDQPTKNHIAYVRCFRDLLRGRFAQAAPLAAATAAAFRAEGDLRRELHPLFIHAMAAPATGDLPAAQASITRMLTLATTSGDTYYQAMAHYGQACLEAIYGDPAKAVTAAREGIRGELTLNSPFSRAHHLETLAWATARQGRHTRAATLFGAAAAMWSAVGSSPEAAKSLAGPHFQYLELAKTALGEEAFDAAYETGRTLPEDDVTHYALTDDTAGE